MRSNQVAFECYACGFESEELSYFVFQNVDNSTNPETICMGCIDRVKQYADDFIEDNE